MDENEHINIEGQIVCPYCGHKHEDDGFWYDEVDCTCEACDKLFEFTFTQKVYFTTKRK